MLICYSLGSAAQSGCPRSMASHEVGKRQRPFWVPDRQRGISIISSPSSCGGFSMSTNPSCRIQNSLEELATRRVSNENFDRHRTSQ